MTDANLWQLIGGCGFVGGATSVIVAAINKRKSPIDVQKMQAEIDATKAAASKAKSEMEGFVVESLTVVLKELREERNDDREQIRLNEERIKTLALEHDDCEFEHGLTRLQLNKALIKLGMTKWIKSTVYVLDDNELVKRVFVHRFKTIPVVNFKAYTDYQECLKNAQEEKPEVMVLDYQLSNGHTAEEIISQLGYQPEIFIMSGNKDFEAKFRDTDIRFFYKDQWYVRNITKAILEHLISKNKDA